MQISKFKYFQDDPGARASSVAFKIDSPSSAKSSQAKLATTSSAFVRSAWALKEKNYFTISIAVQECIGYNFSRKNKTDLHLHDIFKLRCHFQTTPTSKQRSSRIVYFNGKKTRFCLLPSYIGLQACSLSLWIAQTTPSPFDSSDQSYNYAKGIYNYSLKWTNP